MVRFWTLLLVGIALVSASLGQYPSEHEPSSPASSTEHGDRVADSGRPLAAEEHEGHPHQQRRDRDHPSDYENAILAASQDVARATWWLVIVTGVLAFIGFLIGGGQIWLMKGSLDAATKSANAAMIAATQDRAWVVAKVDEVPQLTLGPGTDPQYWVAKWSIVNIGKTPAWITKMAVDFRVLPVPLPPSPEYRAPRAIGDMVLPPDAPHAGALKLDGATGETKLLFVSHAVEVVFYGFVEYRDRIQEPHTTRFCQRWFVQWKPGGKEGTFLFSPTGPDQHAPGPEGWTYAD